MNPEISEDFVELTPQQRLEMTTQAASKAAHEFLDACRAEGMVIAPGTLEALTLKIQRQIIEQAAKQAAKTFATPVTLH